MNNSQRFFPEFVMGQFSVVHCTLCVVRDNFMGRMGRMGRMNGTMGRTMIVF